MTVEQSGKLEGWDTLEPGLHSLEGMPSYEEHMAEMKGADGVAQEAGAEATSEAEPRRKTYQEKAEELGYYRKPDGSWWRKDDFDGFEEECPWFKLDEEYPELADRAEELAEKYGVDLSDYGSGGMKAGIYKAAERFEKADDAYLENLILTRAAITCSYGNTEKILLGYDEKQMNKLVGGLETYYEEVNRLMPGGQLPREVGQVAESLVRHYNDKLAEGDLLTEAAKYAVEASRNRGYGWQIKSGIENGIQGLSDNQESGREFGPYMAYYMELMQDERKATRFDKPAQVLERYVGSHGAGEDVISGFREVIFPMLERGEAEVRPIFDGGNAYGMGNGTYGIADYTEECLISRYEPAQLNKLMRINAEIPTSDYARFEQNRKDAARLQRVIIGGRDFIHDERIGVHEMLVAMKEFYEHHDKEDAEGYQRKLEELEDKYCFHVLPRALDVGAYGQPVEYLGESYGKGQGDAGERAIDILERLVKNTEPVPLEAPEVKDEQLNGFLKGINPYVNEATGEVKVTLEEVAPAMRRMNEILTDKQGEQGVMPSMVAAMAYLDKMATYALRGCGRREMAELPFDEGFREMVKFSQLTSSTSYNEEEFDRNYQKIVTLAGKAYGDEGVDMGATKGAYQELSRWILNNTRALAGKYAEKQYTARFKEAIWSGNLSDRLISMFDEI